MGKAKGLEIMVAHDSQSRSQSALTESPSGPLPLSFGGQNAFGKAKDTTQPPQQMQAQVTVG